MVPVDPVASHEATIGAKQPWRVAQSQSSSAHMWSERQVDNSPASSSSELQLRAEGGQSKLPLLVRVDSLQDLQNAILERAWLQSWVAGDRQQDRAVFRFRSPHARVYVELPPGAATRPLEVLLDGEPGPAASAGISSAIDKASIDQDRADQGGLLCVIQPILNSSGGGIIE